MTSKHLYGFGPYRLDAVERVLRRDGQPVTLPPKDLETLLVLVERAGHIVEKEELLERVWPGVFIEEGNLSRHIFNLRQALGDSAEGVKYIETIPRRGYRFVAAIQEDGDSAAPPQAPLQASEHDLTTVATAQKKNLSLWPLALSVVLAVTAILLSRYFWAPRNTSSQKVMLAVLPFVNMSGDAHEDYFADGLTEEMITQLGQVQPARLGVIARTSAMRYKDSRQSASQICHELGVNYLLEGSVRQAGQRVRIAAQLIQATDQTHLWAENYETPLTDILNTQREIAERITRSLQLQLLPAHVNSNPGPHFDPEAYHKYLLGLNESRKGTREGGEKAIQYFQDAIATEPKNARFYGALAEAYSASVPYYSPPSVAMPMAKQAAGKALELDPNLASAHATLGDAYLLFDWDWKAAEVEYRRALEINPNSPEAQLGYTNYLSTLGRHDEAVSHAQQVYLIDPLALDNRNEALWAYYFSGRTEETVARAQKTIELEPQAGSGYAMLALAYSQMGRRSETLQSAENATRFSDSPSVIVIAVSALARVGERDKARQFLNRAQELAKAHYVCRFLLAAAYADLGENEKALESLERGYREKST